jgi:4-amino-4-deoxy-L-arabinose transferase-like glycosyltransferase
VAEDTQRHSRALPPLPRGVWLIAGSLVLLLLVFAPRYGWHRDELYFLEAGRHLAWGYVDQPPFTPLLARIADTLANGNLVVLRFLPALAAGGTAVVGAITVREMGGSRGSQIAGAGTVAAGGFLLGTGHLLSTATFDLLAWMIVLSITARMLRTADPRWWIAIGAVSGMAMLNKSLVVMLAASIAIGLAAARRWDLFLSPWIVAGVLLAAAIPLPNLLWQASNGWPQLEMSQRISERLGMENRILLIPLQIVFVGPAFIGLFRRGVGWLRSDPGGVVYQTFLWAWAAGMTLTLLTGGRPYYPVALTLMVLLAGIVAFERMGRDARDLRGLIVLNGALSLLISLPVLPVSMANITSTINDTLAETIGWPELVAQIAATVDSLPVSEREGVVILTASYGEAGAIDRFGPSYGLPQSYSAHNSYADFRQPSDDSATVVAVRYHPDTLAPVFEQCWQVAEVDNGYGVDNEAQSQPIVVCQGLRMTWDDLWPTLRHLD